MSIRILDSISKDLMPVSHLSKRALRVLAIKCMEKLVPSCWKRLHFRLRNIIKACKKGSGVRTARQYLEDIRANRYEEEIEEDFISRINDTGLLITTFRRSVRAEIATLPDFIYKISAIFLPEKALDPPRYIHGWNISIVLGSLKNYYLRFYHLDSSWLPNMLYSLYNNGLILEEQYKTSDVRDMAKSIDIGKDFKSIPILADALEDAGFQGDILEFMRTKAEFWTEEAWAVSQLR